MEVLHTNITSFQRYCCCWYATHKFNNGSLIIKYAKDTCFRDIPNITYKSAFELYYKLLASHDEPCPHFSKTDYCSDPTTSADIIFMCFWILLLIVTVTSNLTVIMAIRHVPVLRENTSNLLISSLAASDFLVGLLIIPIKIKYAYHDLKFCSPMLCRLYMTLDNWLFSTSITNLFFISIDRYLALNYPYRHSRYLTYRRCKYLICGIWFYALAWGLLCNFNWMDLSQPSVHIQKDTCKLDNDAYIVSLTSFVFYIPAVTIAIVYIRVLRIARMHARAISDSIVIHNNRALQKEDSATTIQSTSSPGIRGKSGTLPEDEDREVNIKLSIRKELNTVEGESMSSKTIQDIRYRKMNWKASKTVAIVYFTFFFCWFPITAFDLAMACYKKGFNPYDLRWFYYIFVLALPNVHSMVNPFIYGFMNKQYRRSYRRLFAQLKFKLMSKFNKYREKAESVQPATVTK